MTRFRDISEGEVVVLSKSFLDEARWIWTADDPLAPHVWIYARRRFEVTAPAEAVIEITADQRYFLWINGQPVGFGPPKFHAETPTVDRYAIARWLAAGTNVVTVLVYSYGGGNDLSSCMPRRGALRAGLWCDGRPILTDRSWKVRREHAYAQQTARRGENQPPSELFDARRSLGQPWRTDYDDSAWSAATELPELPVQDFEPRDIPLFGWQTRAPDRRIAMGLAEFDSALDIPSVGKLAAEVASARRRPDCTETMIVHRGLAGEEDAVTIDTTALPPTAGGYVLWDFGRLWTGYAVIEVSGTPGTVVDLSYAEYLKDGRLDPTKHGLQYADRIVIGEGRLRHRVTWAKCFRYAQADVRGGRATIHRIELERCTYPVEWQGSFACSDAALDQAWTLGAHTVQLCMEDSFMDTPWRERGAWLGDNVPMSIANYQVFGDAALERRLLLHHTRGQLADGQMRCKYPGCKTSFISTWTLTFPLSVQEYVRFTGDTAFGRAMLPTIRRIHEWMEGYRLPEGVYGNLPLEVTATTNIYNFIDWAPVDTGGANAAWNAYAYASLRATAEVARAAGEPETARSCEERAARLRDAFRQTFWDDVRGIFTNGWRDGQRLRRWGCHENYLAVRYGLADEVQRERILRRLKENDLAQVFVPNRADYDPIIPEAGDSNAMVAIALNRYRWDDERMVPLGTPYFAWHALEVMCELGLMEEALRFIGLRWGEYSRQGGTSTWEAWKRDDGSLSHGWGCAPAIVLGKYVLGVDLGDAATEEIRILPQRGHLKWARGRVVTRHGIVQVAWECQDRWRLEVALPPRCRALVGLPGEPFGLRVDHQPATDAQIIRRHGQVYRAVGFDGGVHVVEQV